MTIEHIIIMSMTISTCLFNMVRIPIVIKCGRSLVFNLIIIGLVTVSSILVAFMSYNESDENVLCAFSCYSFFILCPSISFLCGCKACNRIKLKKAKEINKLIDNIKSNLSEYNNFNSDI